MAAADQQFLDALKYLGESGQRYGIKRQMEDVNARAEEIQNTMTDEIQKRAALRNLANTASISVSGSGGTAQQSAAIQNLIPPIPTTVQSAYLQGSLTGDTQMTGVAEKMLKEDQRRALELAEKKASFELRLSEHTTDRAMARDTMKSGREDYAKLQEGIKSGKAYKVSLLDAQSAYRAGTFTGTGPTDQYTNFLTTQGGVIKNKFAQLLMAEKLHVASVAGGRAADTGVEQQAIKESQPNEGAWEESNDIIIGDKVKITDQILRKQEAAAYSLERSGYMSPTAYASEYRRKGDRTAVSDLPEKNVVKGLFNKSRGGR